MFRRKLESILKRASASKAPRCKPPRTQLTVEQLEDRCAPAVITVNSVADNNVRDDSLTLREAILIVDGNLAINKLSNAEQKQVTGNHVAGQTDTILFNIPGAGLHVVQPGSALDAITNPVVIDGYSQPGSKANTNPVGDSDNAQLEIELDGSKVANAAGLAISAMNSVVKGLVINRFNGGEIVIQGGGGSTISGDFLGILPDGTTGAGGGNGVSVIDSPGNTIGGTDPASRNIISGSRC